MAEGREEATAGPLLARTAARSFERPPGKRGENRDLLTIA